MSRELDAKIAEKVMGWGRIWVRGGWHVDRQIFAEQWLVPPGPWLEKYQSRENAASSVAHQEFYYDIPRYSENMQMAMLVVEKLRERGIKVLLNGAGQDWRAYFWHGERCYRYCRKSLPEAICLAALGVIG